MPGRRGIRFSRRDRRRCQAPRASSDVVGLASSRRQDEPLDYRTRASLIRWFVWDLTRSELVGLVGGRVILARIPVRIPFTRRWRTTTFYMHRWLTDDPSSPSHQVSANCPPGRRVRSSNDGINSRPPRRRDRLGVGGLCAGVRLKQAGIEDFVIIDRAADLGVPGGTMYTRESRWISRR